MKRWVILVISLCFRTTLCDFTNTSIPASSAHLGKSYSSEEDEGIWAPLLENLAVTNAREKRILKLIPIQNEFVNVDRISESKQHSEKQVKISPGKIVSQKPLSGGKQVTETDLYLLGAIEKLVYRTDFMEKRLRKVEEMLYYVMAGNRIDQDPCPNNFSRIGHNCYLISSNAGRELDWKAANRQCKRNGGTLTEMETIEENQDIVAYIQSTPYLRGKDFWTGGLNPGLLWIWSNSARPVPNSQNTDKTNPSTGILGDGRCLRLSYDPLLRTYSYKGTDCAIRYHYICELPENTSSNEISRIGRSKNIFVD